MILGARNSPAISVVCSHLGFAYMGFISEASDKDTDMAIIKNGKICFLTSSLRLWGVMETMLIHF